MIKLIQNITGTNDGEQHKGNNNSNITKYLEFNKDVLSDLGQKNYEDLIEALANMLKVAV